MKNVLVLNTREIRTFTRVKRPLFLSKRANNNTGICFVSLRCLLKTICGLFSLFLSLPLRASKSARAVSAFFYCIARCLRKRFFVVRSLSLSVSSHHVKSEESGDSFAASKRRTVWAEIENAYNTISIYGT